MIDGRQFDPTIAQELKGVGWGIILIVILSPIIMLAFMFLLGIIIKFIVPIGIVLGTIVGLYSLIEVVCRFKLPKKKVTND